ncbi:hypothetical protein SLEP1_g41147 [Rubroshorea leprosula]|uniref:Peptidase M16 N-terminal domain-containing protein n=1 Tax=Rubroshorea leprosula TaxID=152421 RepID=A0AAV5L5M6_9ROSI|nr:hypothetical protein SLEP1_g41147 [Rubroshorea leprosula]
MTSRYRSLVRTRGSTGGSSSRTPSKSSSLAIRKPTSVLLLWVGVGSFSDPDGLKGVAHFLEHMLFYASEKYPLEDSYSKYIAEHGGRTNAFTASESTNFHSDVNIDGFEEALDR